MFASIQRITNPPKSTVTNTHVSPPQPTTSRVSNSRTNRPIRTSYTSLPTPIPEDFLAFLPAYDHQISLHQIDFANSPLPEYAGLYAVVLDGVLSEEECKTLIGLAEKSAVGEDGKADEGWKPAMLNVGAGYEVVNTEVRHCDRIIWDSSDLVKRIWRRCLLASNLGESLVGIEDQPAVQGYNAAKRGEKWEFIHLNERMRFLRYGPGHYFKSHTDGQYVTPDETAASFYTLHLYLNTLPQPSGVDTPPPFTTEEPASGGATTFLPSYRQRAGKPIHVPPHAGRVLIFQHRGLLHDGAEVRQGVKITMRTDLMYKLVKDEDEM